VYQYDPPAGFFGGGGVPPETWTSINADGLIAFYPFRPFTGEYEAARRKDPGFGGTYSVEGEKVTLRLGNETVVADFTAEGHLVIRGTTYTKSKLKDQ